MLIILAWALQIKLDELIHVFEKANNQLLDLEELDEEDLEKIRHRYISLAKKAREPLKEE